MAVGQRSYRQAASTIALMLLALMTTFSLLPLVETDVWWIRFLDFPRLQFAVVLIGLVALYLVLMGRPGILGWVAIAAATVAAGYQAYNLYPYFKLMKPAAAAEANCPDGQSLRVMIANVKKRYEDATAFLDQVGAAAPNILLVMETDEWWDDRLSVLDEHFRYSIQSIPEDHAFYGMHLFSDLELISPEFKFLFNSHTPTALAKVRLPGGDEVGFIGLHPQPPLAWSQPTTMRDAHLHQAALLAREADVPTIIAGDFNAVPWERATRRAMRIGQLLDPRVGRGLFPTYDTKSYLITWPLDQILFQPQFTLQHFDTLPDLGSDHRAVVATLCHARTTRNDAPRLLENDLAEANTSIEAARAIETAQE